MNFVKIGAMKPLGLLFLWTYEFLSVQPTFRLKFRWRSV